MALSVTEETQVSLEDSYHSGRFGTEIHTSPGGKVNSKWSRVVSVPKDLAEAIQRISEHFQAKSYIIPAIKGENKGGKKSLQ